MIDSRKTGIRKKLRAKSDRPRLSVFRSNKYIYAQIIDDAKGVTLAFARGTKPEEVGTAIAKASVKAGVGAVVFDRGDSRYHGQIKTLAEAARSGGLDF